MNWKGDVGRHKKPRWSAGGASDRDDARRAGAEATAAVLEGPDAKLLSDQRALVRIAEVPQGGLFSGFHNQVLVVLAVS